MSKVLVTGGSGFLGAYVVRDLAERGDEVVVYDISYPSGAMVNYLKSVIEKVKFIKGQLNDLPTLIRTLKEEKVEKVVHSGALFDPQFSLEQPYLTYKINVEGTLNVLESVRILGLEKIVHVSTIGVFPVKQYEPMDERHPVFLPTEGHPTGPYGASKAACEIFGLTYYTFNKVNFIALRFSAIYGYGMRYPMYIKPMVENSLRGLPVEFATGGDMPRDYTYVKDCAQSILKALDADDKDLKQRVFLISGGEVIKASEVAEVVKEVVPTAQIKIGAGLSEFEKSDVKKRGKLDISAAVEQLKYQPQYNLKKGIQEYVELYKQYENL